MRRPLEGDSILILVQLEDILYRTLEGEEIKVAVRGLRTGRVREPSGIRTENLKVWLREAKREKDPDPRWWDKMASVTKLTF